MRRILDLLPGILLCGAITTLAFAIQAVERHRFGYPYIDALVVAILVGIGIRSVWQPGPRWQAGIAFSAKQLLEVAVAMLGASLSLTAILATGAALLAGIIATVALAMAAGYGICRLLGLPIRMAILVAGGNAICGNSAIAAIAPVIGADGKDVAAAIAFTAILGVLVVLGLPLVIPLTGYSPTQYGVLAGLTVYAVPQVLAATAPAGLVSTQIGTLVKLVRVLMLGPLLLAMSILAPRLTDPTRPLEAPPRPGLGKLVPWFILAFLALALLRSAGLIPDTVTPPLTLLAGLLTVLSMAALGLGVDIGSIARIGGRVTAAVTGSLLMLMVISFALIGLLDLQ